jgi:RNA polymerase sigma-70 factor (ECF subfamily)
LSESIQSRQNLFLEIETHRGYLLRYAGARLRDTAQAEEVVQEALLAALAGSDSFSGKASLRTWLTAILKFKIIDLQRSLIADRAHFVSATGDDDSADPDWLDRQFDETGHWHTQFAEWSDPDKAFEQKEFFARFEQCMDKLPGSARRVFFQREVMGLDTDEICKDECITSSNCWVMLHRARVSLRECLERNWFVSGKK